MGLTLALLKGIISNDLEWSRVTSRNIQWHEVSRGFSATAELLVLILSRIHVVDNNVMLFIVFLYCVVYLYRLIFFYTRTYHAQHFFSFTF